jgi:predicted amidohydrolase
VKDSLTIALVQMTSVDSLATNLQKFESIFEGMKSSNVELICFPENCLFMRIRETDSIEKFDLHHSCFLWLGEWAKKLRTSIHLGSIPLTIEGSLYNSSVWFGTDGKPQVGYQKMHLFDIELAGQKSIKESAVFRSGQMGRVHEINGWSFGESICYDLRFSELYSKYAYIPVDVILVPSAFLVDTGRAHWEVLLRARAIESQCYVVASAQVGTHQSTKGTSERNTYGHSMVIDPWGRVEQESGETESVHVLNLTKQVIQKVRDQMPMARHGRKDREK